MGAFPNLSRHVPFCPRLFSVVLLTVCKLGAMQKARLRKSTFFGDFLGVFDFLRACSVRIPQENL